MPWAHRYLDLNGFRTHYLEVGDGPAVVLLHGGEYGAGAEVTWASCMEPLADGHRVIAMDFFGYGDSDKIRDLRGQRRRQLEQVGALLDALAIDSAHFVGSSMSGRMVLEAAKKQPTALPMRSLTAIGVGLFPPSGPEHRALFEYDGSLDGLREILPLLFHSPRFAADEDYLRYRHLFCTIPGAWEFGAASRLRLPRQDDGAKPVRPTVPAPPAYHEIALPTCLVLGEHDRLVPRESWDQLGEQIPHAISHVLDGVGHYPQVETPDLVVALLRDFFATVDGA